jgi:tRNA A37 threonylcarbamoyladenosine biosynthesis protein TsaE
VNVYRGRDESRLFHMDAYRLDSASEAEELDLDAMLSQGPLIIEWPERMEGLVPPENLWVNLEHIAEDEREMRFRASGERYDALLEVVRKAAYGGD